MTGVILAGGNAARFGGRAKGLETVGGARILDRVAAALAPACDRLLLVAHAPDASDWLPGVPVAADVRPGLGSLGGLHAALAHARTPVLVVAWDMPFVTAPLLLALRAPGDAGARAVRPVHPDGRVEPLCAYYDARCLATVERLLDAGARRARALGDVVGAATLDGAALAAFGDPAVLLSSVNAPDDLARARLFVDHLASPPR
ncbi:MAG: molybdenum cofactor guanylyltransferase [Gemmatirosa sp.]